LVGGDGTHTVLECVAAARALETAFGILPLDLITSRNAPGQYSSSVDNTKPPVTNQVTTPPGNGRHSATYPDTYIFPTCGKPT